MSQEAKPRFINFLVPRLRDVFWVAVFFAALGMGPAMMNVDGDLGRHITIGRYILDSRSIPTTDVFSHSMAGQPLTPHEWLAQVLFALADRLMGLDGVVLLAAATLATTFSLTYNLAARRSGSRLAGLVFTLLAAGAASIHWLTRPHIFTFLLLAIWLWILDELSRGNVRRWAWMPVVMLLWVNLHGAFIAGFATWALVLAGWAWEHWVEGRGEDLPPGLFKALLLGGAASALVSFLNPAGAHLWATSLGYIGNEYLVGHTAEYLSPDFHSSSMWLFLLLVIALVGLFGLANRRRQAVELFVSGAWMAMGLFSARNIPLFGMVVAPVLANAWAEVIQTQMGRWKTARWVHQVDLRLAQTEETLRGAAWPVLAAVAAAVLLVGGARLDANRAGNRFDPQQFPVQAADWLLANPLPGNGFNYFPWGGYLLYRGWPELRVFIDGQTDFYGEELTRRYEQVLTLAEGWQDVFQRYRIEWVIWPKNESLAKALQNDIGWEIVYSDQTTVVFRKR